MIDSRKPEYIGGLDGFLEFAFSGKEDSAVKCPWMECNLILYHD